MLAYIDEHEAGIMVDALKLILFDAEKRLFIIQGLFPLDQYGCPLPEDKYADFYNLWVAKLAKEWKDAVSGNRTTTNKVNEVLLKLECNSIRTLFLVRNGPQASALTLSPSRGCSPSPLWSRGTTGTRGTRTSGPPG